MRVPIIIAAAVFTACGPAAGSFTMEDERAVRALEEAYRAAWLANDSAGVMSVLSEDAVLMPAGVQPLRGDSAIRRFWWPADGSRTTITSYELTLEEVEGSADLAFVRGRGDLAFTYRSPEGEVSHLTSRAVHLSLARRDPDGEWRIARRIWSAVR